jgi:hypothetical protein
LPELLRKVAPNKPNTDLYKIINQIKMPLTTKQPFHP